MKIHFMFLSTLGSCVSERSYMWYVEYHARLLQPRYISYSRDYERKNATRMFKI